MRSNKNKMTTTTTSLDTGKAHGCDDISIAMIKICDDSIVDPLCLIFEICLETGIYPSAWKKANIIPVHKKESRQSKKNYSSSSLLPIFGKLFEKIIFDAIYCHLCENGLLTPDQSGFRPSDSTINQLYINHIRYIAPSRKLQARKRGLSSLICPRLLTGCGTRAYYISLNVMAYLATFSILSEIFNKQKTACCTEWLKFRMDSDICRGTTGLCSGSLILSYLYK